MRQEQRQTGSKDFRAKALIHKKYQKTPCRIHRNGVSLIPVTKRQIIWTSISLLVLGAAVTVAFVGYRAKRLYQTAKDWKSEVRYLIENGGTVGEAPAAEAMDQGYLEAVFGGDPDLLAKLRGVIAKGMAEDPAMNLGEVAAMVVTYHVNQDKRVEDVAAHIIGGFPLGQRKRGFHRDGYFNHQIDHNLWNAGNSAISFLGRDILVFADENVVTRQQELLESILSGNILPLANIIMDRPLHYTAVFPDPRRVVPPQLRPHIQAVIIKGHLAPDEGSWEMMVLTPKPESASYALSMLYDMKLAGEIALQSRFEGIEKNTDWGLQKGNWWSYEMVKNLQKTTMEKEQNIVRMKVSFDRVMVNATLKTLERMGRDLAQMQGSLEEKLDPRLVDARMKSGKPAHYWNDEHRWGPDWPIGSPSNRAQRATTALETPAESPAEPVTQAL